MVNGNALPSMVFDVTWGALTPTPTITPTWLAIRILATGGTTIGTVAEHLHIRLAFDAIPIWHCTESTMVS